VRNSLFPQRKILRYLSIQQWFAEQNKSPFYSCVFDSDITRSYCWSISKDGFFILGGAFPLKEGKSKLQLLKSKLRQHGFAFGEPLKTEACLISLPRGLRDFCVGYHGAFLLGEAAGFISPSSLEGISYALNSAYALAAVINSRCPNPNRAYRIKTLPIRIKLLGKCLKVPFMYWPFLRKCIMKSGLRAIQVVDKNHLH
jgi:flavin-dependent dehydrogenase